MILFVRCSLEKVKRDWALSIYPEQKTDIWYNDPVNLDLCYSFQKSTWLTGFPSIIFSFYHASIDWIYDNEEDRDKDYNRLLTIYGSTPVRR